MRCLSSGLRSVNFSVRKSFHQASTDRTQKSRAHLDGIAGHAVGGLRRLSRQTGETLPGNPAGPVAVAACLVSLLKIKLQSVTARDS